MLLLIDLDGVVYRGRDPVPGMPELLREGAAAGDAIVYCTNNSRWHRSEYLAHLQEIGVPVEPERIVTAARATALALAGGEGTRAGGRADRSAAPDPVMVFGGPGLARELRDVGLRVVAPTVHGLAAAPATVVVGVDFSLSYARLSIAAEAVRRGARFVATNRDAVYPAADGLMAGAGSIVAALAVASGREPDLVVGKPEPTLFRQAAELCGEPVERAIVIGDGLATDIVAAAAVGARSVLMLTGVTTLEQLEAADRGAVRPTAVAADAAELRKVLERFAAAD
jgi:HAD superfamily hydrolase (TIGR01450 family)